VNTVYHGDHYYGNNLFPNSTTIVMHTESKKYINSKFEADRRFMINLMGNDKGLDDVKPRAGDIMIDHDTNIDLGGRVVEIKVFGQGQTKGDLFVWLPQEKAMFTSNAVLAEQPQAVPMDAQADERAARLQAHQRTGVVERVSTIKVRIARRSRNRVRSLRAVACIAAGFGRATTL
jgi:glyoxylase-like metal-dependent hydrolase (beta-lactamase superfamily II)